MLLIFYYHDPMPKAKRCSHVRVLHTRTAPPRTGQMGIYERSGGAAGVAVVFGNERGGLVDARVREACAQVARPPLDCEIVSWRCEGWLGELWATVASEEGNARAKGVQRIRVVETIGEAGGGDLRGL